VGEQQYVSAAIFIALVTAVCLPLYYYRHQIIRRFHRRPRVSRSGRHEKAG
jgi:hypothetical protein